MTEGKTGGDGQKEEKPREITFHYEKSNYFRVIHVDGAFGGLSPHGLIDMAVFSERLPIPKITVQTIKEGKTLGEEIREKRMGREGIFRELEANLVFGLDTAKTLISWLQEKVQQLENLQSEIEKDRGAN